MYQGICSSGGRKKGEGQRAATRTCVVRSRLGLRCTLFRGLSEVAREINLGMAILIGGPSSRAGGSRLPLKPHSVATTACEVNTGASQSHLEQPHNHLAIENS